MARKKFEEGFKENAIEYCKIHSDKTIKACAADLEIGYSTLRRWIAQSEEQDQVGEAVSNDGGVATAMEDVATQDHVENVGTSEKEEQSIEEVPIESVSQADSNEFEVTIVEETNSTMKVQEDAFYDDFRVEAFQEDLDDEFDWINRREQMKSHLGGFIENAGSGVSDAVQLIGLYKRRRELKKVQKKLQKEKEKRLKH